ncbi:hypothetical protein [Brevundimonas sp. GCM10030266]|uniref:hypothetical protein n=1 Tax=Brevundimonas sp. GCM10030266 TaxID=3273386 RepID=UPI00360D8A83
MNIFADDEQIVENARIIAGLAATILMTPKPARTLDEAFIWEGPIETRPMITWGQLEEVVRAARASWSAEMGVRQ